MKLQDRYSSLSPIYNEYLTNHLPMMITALRELGVDDRDIEYISEQYIEERNILDLHNEMLISEFEKEYIRLSNFFLKQIDESSVDDVIRDVLNKNISSLHSALNHGIIRLSYAYVDGSPLLIAQALAYFDLVKNENHFRGDSVDIEQIDEMFQTLVNDRKELITLETNNTSSKYQTLYTQFKDSLFVPREILKYKSQILQFFLEYYNKTKDFYMLHVITGYHAMHVLAEFFDNQHEAYEQYFYNALLFMLFNDHNRYVIPNDEGDFDVNLKEVRFFTDAHEIKLFHSLYYFYQLYGLDDLKKCL